MPDFRAVDDLTLIARTSRIDLGIRRVGHQLRDFELHLKPETYAQLAELTEPFERLDHERAFQWLDESGDARLLLSPSGWW